MCKRIPVNALNPFVPKKMCSSFNLVSFFFFFVHQEVWNKSKRNSTKMTSINFPYHYPAEQASFASCFETSGGKCEASLMTEASNLPPPPFPLKRVSPLLPDVCILHISSPSGQIPTINSYMNYLYFCCRQFLKLWAFRSWLTITNPEIGMCTFSIRAKAFYCIIDDILSFAINNVSACKGFRQLFSAPAGGEERVSTNSFINYIASGSKTCIPTP